MSSESRIWEIRLFGSMRGGEALVIGLYAFQSILSRLLYETKVVWELVSPKEISAAPRKSLW